MVNVFITRRLSKRSDEGKKPRRIPTWTPKTVKTIAKDLPDKLIVKMPLEHAQMAITVLRLMKKNIN